MNVHIKYDYLKMLFKDQNQSHNSKLFSFQQYMTAYKNYQTTGTLSFCDSMVNIVSKSTLSRATIYSILAELKKSNQFLTVKRKYIYSDDLNSNRCDKSVYEFVFNINSLPSWAINKSYNSINTSKVESSVQVSQVTVQLKPDDNLTNACLNNKEYIINNSDNTNIDINSLPTLPRNTQNTSSPNKSNFKKQDNKKVIYFNPRATLKSYSPITDIEAIKINKNSGRDFSTNFINQLLLKFSDKFPSRTFPTRNHMLSYMTKAIKYELHQSHKVNNDTFTLKCNISNDNCNISAEKYLSAIESNTNISHKSELKRKIAGVFSPEKAYLILSNSSFTFSDHNFNIKFTKHIPLSQSDKDIITREVKAVYGNVAINIEQPNNTQTHSAKQKNSSDDHLLTSPIPGESSVCHQIRLALISDLGAATYKSWFIKAKMIDNTDNSTLTLIMPTGFYAHWVSTRFGPTITRIANSSGLSFINYQSTS